MQQGPYYIKMNHLPRYAAASAQEVLLRAYCITLGSFDPEDIMLESDCTNLRKAAVERSQTTRAMFLQYAQEMVKLLTKKYE